MIKEFKVKFYPANELALYHHFEDDAYRKSSSMLHCIRAGIRPNNRLK